MFLVSWFGLVTLWIVGFCLVGEGSKFRHWSNAVFPVASLATIIVLAAAPANYDVVDKTRYAAEFETMSFAEPGEVFDTTVTDGREPAFLLVNWLIGSFTHDADVYFLIVAAFCAIMLTIALWMILGSGWQTAVVLYVTVCFGFFLDYSSFLVRQGLSISFLFLGLALVLRNARVVWILVVLGLGLLFHWSAIAPAIVILVVRLVRLRTDILLGAWVIFSIAYFTGLNARLAGPLGSGIEQIEVYSDSELARSYSGGTNRPIFWLLSAGPLFVAYAAVKRRLAHLPEWYPKLLNAFILLNCYFLALGFVYFSDRLAAFSWSLIPVLVSVPVLRYTGRFHTVLSLALLVAFGAWALYFGSFGTLLNR
ncbi:MULTISPECIES: EpsG family protein [Brevibacterium]|uniref:EpsG family protein n=3 Tax=Bacteria TaxID=2 RepID=A0AB34XXF5_9MICO|nr:EpsG family protein [Brevibacterium casei]KZE21662.1 hypothetical protein AVW13_09410 [Brevibacterium casei]MCT2182946.1 EpsG family protein [Brevibacterium casei]NJE67565.1 hypothetical protein [Brevibacterium sp. LS14]